MAVQSASLVRAAVLRSSTLSLEKSCSIGFRGYGAAAISGAPSPLKLADGAPHDAAERPEPVRHSL